MNAINLRLWGIVLFSIGFLSSVLPLSGVEYFSYNLSMMIVGLLLIVSGLIMFEISWRAVVPSKRNIPKQELNPMTESLPRRVMPVIPNPARTKRIESASRMVTNNRIIPDGQNIVEETYILNLSSNWEDKVADSDIVFRISDRAMPVGVHELEVGVGMDAVTLIEMALLEETMAQSLVFSNVGLNKDYTQVRSLINGKKPVKVAIAMVGAASDEEYADQTESLKVFIESIKS